MQANPQNTVEATLMVATVSAHLRLPSAPICTLATMTRTVEWATIHTQTNHNKYVVAKQRGSEA